MRRARSALSAVLLVALSPASARAVPIGATSDASSAGPYPDAMTPWRLARPRYFLSATVDAGFTYLRPTFAAGLGRPHYWWAGAELLPQANANMGGLYGGFRAALPYLEVRAGARVVRPFLRSQLPIRETYDLRDLQTEREPPRFYESFELEALPEVRLGRGHVIGAFSAFAIRGIEDDRYLYEENLRVIVAPPVILRARLGYLVHLDPAGDLRVGPAGEVFDVPGRADGVTIIRAGVVSMLRINEHLDVLAQLLLPIVSPDAIGLHGADMNQLGIRYRWATK